MFKTEDREFRFQWDWKTDQATLTNSGNSILVWSGSLLPTLQLTADPATGYVKAVVTGDRTSGDTVELALDFGGLATGKLTVENGNGVVYFRALDIDWKGESKPIMGLFFGLSPLPKERLAATPDATATFWPDWRAEGFCSPGAKGNPGQSFWRFWDMGHSVLPLGNFGPCMGTPYAAAFPRPLLASAMGGNHGWFSFGPGEIPASALSLDTKSASAMLRFWMREDLWGAPAGNSRTIREPLRLSWHLEAWDSIDCLFRTFPVDAAPRPEAQHSQWGTWGEFKEGRFDLTAHIKKAALLGAQDVVIDDLWETWNSSGIHDVGRFPNFPRELDILREHGLTVGIWQSIGWIDKPEEVGLGPEDLLCRPDGTPCLSNWGADPRTKQPLHYCLDPSSPKAQEFLIKRTQHTIREYKPGLLKLDFGYGMPGPDAVSPRNPELRGERLCAELLRLIVETARKEDPKVAVQYYGVHPLMRPYYDLLSLDDMGDMGAQEALGHHQRSAWAAFTGWQNVAVMATSGYFINELPEILWNAAVIGAPGACPPDKDPHGVVASTALICRFRASTRWHRRTVGWEPLWLNSHKGNIDYEPQMRCWGRMEGDKLTSVAIRDGEPAPDLSKWGIRSWTGRWTIISQDDGACIANARSVAFIPFDEGEIVVDSGDGELQTYTFDGAEEQVATDSVKGTLTLQIPEGGLDDLMGFVFKRA